MKRTIAVIATMTVCASACSTGNPQTDHELACAGGMFSGAVIGGLVGNQFGSGQGRAAMTAIGTGAGTFAGTQLAC